METDARWGWSAGVNEKRVSAAVANMESQVMEADIGVVLQQNALSLSKDYGEAWLGDRLLAMKALTSSLTEYEKVHEGMMTAHKVLG